MTSAPGLLHKDRLPEMILPLFVSGRSCRSIGRELGMRPERVRQLLQARGINTGWTQLDVPKLKRLYESGQTVRQVARALHCCTATVCDAMKYHGIQARRRGRQRVQEAGL